MQQQVVGQLGGAGVPGGRNHLGHRAAGERPAGQLVPPQLGAADLVEAEGQGDQRRPAPRQPRGQVGQVVKGGPAGRDRSPAPVRPRRRQVVRRVSGHGHRTAPGRPANSRPLMFSSRWSRFCPGQRAVPGDGSSGIARNAMAKMDQPHGVTEIHAVVVLVNPERWRGAVCEGQSNSSPGPVWNTGLCPTISRMTVTLLTSQSVPTTTDADALVTGVFQGQDGPVLTLSTDEIDLMAALTALGATGKAEELTKIPTGGQLPAPGIVAVGLGPEPGAAADRQAYLERLRRAAGVAARDLTAATPGSKGRGKRVAVGRPAGGPG